MGQEQALLPCIRADQQIRARKVNQQPLRCVIPRTHLFVEGIITLLRNTVSVSKSAGQG